MAKLQSVRGTHDLIGENAADFREIDETAWACAQKFGYQQVSTPIFEFTQVFQKSLGETTDVVSKEMYVFEDRGGESLCLRPEGTAAVVRAMLSNGLERTNPLKLYYQGPMFRYERPQKGRQRQFHQFGVEFFGSASPLADVETLCLGDMILKGLGLRGNPQDGEVSKSRLELNSIGDAESRANFRDKLVSYLQPFSGDLSEDSKTRLEKNPLRILDSKSESDQKILQDAPKIYETLTNDARAHFDQVCEQLSGLGIEYSINEKLVRGLDYYDHTVFEFVGEGLGAQNAILSGGRYNGLVKQMGGSDIPAVGFAAGIERLHIMRSELGITKASERPVAIVIAEPVAEGMAMALAQELRSIGLTIEIPFSGNFGKKMKKANGMNASHAIILGGSEVEAGSFTIKTFDSGEQETVSDFESLIKTLKF